MRLRSYRDVPLIAMLAAACSPAPRFGPPPVDDTYRANRGVFESTVKLGHNVALGQLAGSLLDAPVVAPRANLRSLPDALGGTIENAAINAEIGHALAVFLATKPIADVSRYGVSLLTAAELFGSGDNNNSQGLCENIELDWTFQDDAEGEMKDYEGRVAIWGYSFFTTPIQPLRWNFSQQLECRDALLAAHGDVAAAIRSGKCNTGHELSFFREGSECRMCVGETMGDFAACVNTSRCADSGQVVESVSYASGETVWFDVFYAYLAACAPGYTVQGLLLANEKADEVVPEAFDHASWAHLCAPYWSEAMGAPVFSCSGDTLPTLYDAEVLTSGVLGPTRYLRAVGTTDETWRDRRFYARDIRLANGLALRSGWSGNPGGGVISAPPSHQDTNHDGHVGLGDENFGQQYIGYGLNPFALRPDGTDPMNVDHLFARDWLAASVLKTSTHTNGVPVVFYNHNRGTHAPDEGWLNDNVNWWYDTAHQRPYVHATATLASSGLPDPHVPGGIVVHVAASETFADPLFEGCDGYANTFAPDLAPLPDIPDQYAEDAASMVGETYLFGKDESGIRVVVNTNWRRHHCPTDGTP